MKISYQFHFFCFVVLMALTPFSVLAQEQPATTPATDGGEVTPAGDELMWPREFVDNGTKVDIYQPQIEKWDGADFETRSAVAVTPPGSNAPVYGVFWMKARADVDKAARIVTLNDIQVTKAMFPSAPDQQAAYLTLIRAHVPSVTKTVALDHLEASYAMSEAVKKSATVQVKNDPPRIIFSSTPSLLVLVDGPPALRPAPGVEMQRVINSQALILKWGLLYYLYASDHWYEAAEVEGPWSLVSDPSALLDEAKQAIVANQTVDLMPPGTNAVTTTPAIYVSTVPAELIQSEGAPNLVPIEGTDLMQVENSDNALFLNETDQRYYVLISGRWFDASSLSGPWAFVPYEALPKDFSKIPPTHPKANALVSVPGTQQAEEAVIANSIPQTATVQRNEAKLDVTYDGAPQFRPISGTPLQYAINTTVPVIEVDPQSFYSVQNGVWFVATSSSGPWAVATSVPSVIYSIPASSPLHYVTYAQVYGSTPDEVYVGYTPGYLGTEVCPNYVVVYGTGWYYPPYIGNYWVGWPCTYGFGVGFADNWGIGFGFGFGAGAFLGTWCHPWWGPFGWGWHHHYNYNHVSLNHIDIYHHWGPGIVHSEHNYGFNAWNGRQWSRNWDTHFNPYSSRAFGRGDIGRMGAYNGNFHAHVAQPVAPHTFEQHNFYGGRDGNVYRYNPSGNWERNTGQGWQRAPETQRPALERHDFGNNMGEQRFNNYRSFGGGFGRGGGGRVGGGGIGGGGGRGGGGGGGHR